MTDLAAPANSLPAISLSASAAARINKILASQPGARLLRVSVVGGGCSGFSYKFDFDSETAATDIVLERDGAQVAIDDVSAGFLAGAEIDFVDELIGSAFRIRNPNATASCGCGTSFAM